jgi:hypothetical protein
MTRKQAALKVFKKINEELEKIDKESHVAKRLRVINEELCESIIQLINKYECISMTNYATQESNSPTTISEKQSAETLN